MSVFAYTCFLSCIRAGQYAFYLLLFSSLFLSGLFSITLTTHSLFIAQPSPHNLLPSHKNNSTAYSQRRADPVRPEDPALMFRDHQFDYAFPVIFIRFLDYLRPGQAKSHSYVQDCECYTAEHVHFSLFS